MDVFSWSLPFVQEKVMEILYSVIKKTMKVGGMDCSEMNEEEEKKVEAFNAKIGKFKGCKVISLFPIVKPDVVKYKLNFIGKCIKMQTNLRENRELLLKLKGMCPDNKIPKGLLLATQEVIRDGNQPLTPF